MPKLFNPQSLVSALSPKMLCAIIVSMAELHPGVSLIRGLVYAAALLLCSVRGGPGIATRATLLAPVVLLTLSALSAR